MLRQILGVKRSVDDDGILENWVDWQIRSTKLAEDMAETYGVPDWVTEVHRRRFQWAAQVCRRNDDRWTLQALRWSINGSRRRGRPVTRWTDSFNNFFKTTDQHDGNAHADRNSFWMTLAQDEEAWSKLEEDYLNRALGL